MYREYDIWINNPNTTRWVEAYGNCWGYHEWDAEMLVRRHRKRGPEWMIVKVLHDKNKSYQTRSKHVES